MEKLDVIIPAGGKLDDAFARCVGTHSKALIKFEEITILERTINALRDSGCIDRIVVIGSSEVIESSSVKNADEVIPEGKSGPENIYRGLDFLMSSDHPPQRVIITTCDLPFMTPKVIQDFMTMCPMNIDFCVPLVSRDEYQEVFPQAEATFIQLIDGIYTTGCFYNVSTKALKKALHQIDHLFQNRKSKLGMARMLGFVFAWKLMNKRLRVSDIEKKVHELFNCSGAAVHHAPPEFAYDIDYLDDYQYALAAFQSQKAADMMARS